MYDCLGGAVITNGIQDLDVGVML